MYWLTRLDGVSAVLCVASIVGVILMGIATVACFAAWVEDNEWPECGFILWLWGPVLLLLAGALLTPTTKEMAEILIVPKIVNNAKVQELPEAVLTLANEWLQELRPENLKPESKGEK
jgi:hypothetical protein